MFKRVCLVIPSFVLGVTATATFVSAATVVSFESGYVDNQVLHDGEALLDKNGVASSVLISTMRDNTMSIEASGGQDSGPAGYVNDPASSFDTESSIATSSMDGFFLRSTSALKGDFFAHNSMFTLDFLGGASSVSAEIWDIDGNVWQGSEGWEVMATLTGGNTTSILSPTFMNTSDEHSLNGQAWNFEFKSDGNDILSLDFIFNGSKKRGIGMAFDNLTVATVDNLTVAPVPLPAGGAFLLAGLGALGVLRRRKSICGSKTA